MDLLPSEYERQIAKKRIPCLLSAIATAENRAELWSEDKAKQEGQRAQRLRSLVAQLLAMTATPEEMNGPQPVASPSRRRPGGASPTPLTRPSSSMTAAPPAAALTAQNVPPTPTPPSILVTPMDSTPTTPPLSGTGDERSTAACAVALPSSDVLSPASSSPAPVAISPVLAVVSAAPARSPLEGSAPTSAVELPHHHPASVIAPVPQPAPVGRPMNTAEVAPGVRTRRRGDSHER